MPSTPTGPDDVLARLRSGFELQYDDNHRTAAELRWFVNHPDYLNRVFTRAQRYLPYIVAELERRDMPLELALLPIVESAYDPFAYSHGRAAGLWQMIPGTAKRFGIKQNWWYDGRRDVVDSTRAALDYLEYLEELNDGNWLNAIASYNSGEGNVLRAARNNRKAGKPADFWNLRLPRETSMYVPKLLALVEIVADPDKHNLALPIVADEQQFVVTWPPNSPVSTSTRCTSTTRDITAGRPIRPARIASSCRSTLPSSLRPRCNRFRSASGCAGSATR
jgi:membrane-bound lytic murein transglycosylase D